MAFGGYALLTVAVVLAWMLSRRAIDHRPVALLLLYLVTNIVRRAIVTLVLAPAHLRFDPTPLEGWAEVAAHVDTALFLAPRAMMAGVAVAVFAPGTLARRRILAVASACVQLGLRFSLCSFVHRATV